MGLNLGDCLRLSAIERPDAPCLVYEGLRLDYTSVDRAARKVAGMLLEMGIGQGDRVALLLPNIPQFPIIYYGILYAGATAIPLNPLMRPAELTHIVADAQVRLIFAFADVADAALTQLGTSCVDQVFVVEHGMQAATPPQGASFMAAFGAADPVDELALTNPDDIAVILYSAAQYGRARGAMLSHFNLFNNALTISTRTLRYYPEDIFLCVLPLFHGFGQTTMLNAPLLTGSTIVMSAKFDPGHVVDLINAERVTLLAMVPTMLHYLLAGIREPMATLDSVRCIVAGGSKLNIDAATAFAERFGVPVLEGYGLTETSPVVAFNGSPETNRPGSVGLPIWGCEVAILDDNDNPLPPGQEGEVAVRGHNVFQGYLNDDDGTEEILRGGWLHTGDLGFLDTDGYLTLTGLKKDMILRAGMNVYPREVERVLEEHHDIVEAAVIGVPELVRGEDVKAFVVLREGASLTENELKAYCRDVLSSYKCPRRIEFVTALPRKPDGSVDKAALRAGVAEQLAK